MDLRITDNYGSVSGKYLIWCLRFPCLSEKQPMYGRSVLLSPWLVVGVSAKSAVNAYVTRDEILTPSFESSNPQVLTLPLLVRE